MIPFLKSRSLKTRTLKTLACVIALAIAGGQVAQAQPRRAAIAEMIELQGSVDLKRGKDNYRAVKKGEALEHGDLVKVKRGSKAVIRCNTNAIVWSVPDDGLPWGVANVCLVPTTPNNSGLRNSGLRGLPPIR